MNFDLTKIKSWLLLMLLVFACPLLSTPCFSAEKYSGEIGEVKGTVEILKEGETEWTPVVEEMPVQLKDRLKTSEKSSCNLELDDGSIIYVGENTETSVEFLELTGERHNSKISLWFGKIIANISKSKDTKMEIHSPTAIVAVRGTEFAVEATQEQTDVGVFDGIVGVKSIEDTEAEEVFVKPDEETTVLRGRRPRKPRRLSPAMLKYRKRNIRLRKQVKRLKERLKRLSPEKRAKIRHRALKRFEKIRAKRFRQLRKLRLKKRTIRREIIRDRIRENR